MAHRRRARRGRLRGTLLEPANEVELEGQFIPLGDGAYLVEGPNGAHDATRSPATRGKAHHRPAHRGAHASLNEAKGPGRADNGNFALAKIDVTVTPKDGQAMAVKIARAFRRSRTELQQPQRSRPRSMKTGLRLGRGRADRQGPRSGVRLRASARPPPARLHDKLSFSCQHAAQHRAPRLALLPPLIRSSKAARFPHDRRGDAERTRRREARRHGARPVVRLWKLREKSWQTAYVNSPITTQRRRAARRRFWSAPRVIPARNASQGAAFFNRERTSSSAETEPKTERRGAGILQVSCAVPTRSSGSGRRPRCSVFGRRRRSRTG